MHDLRTYQVFLSLAATRHFGRTAEQCNLSPSAVTRHLQRLESSVGQKLVNRDNRQMNLTPAGRHFLAYARRSVDDWHRLRSDLSTGENSLAGEVRVFGSVTATYSLMAQILPGMRASHPGVELKLRTGDQADGIERVLDGADDSAIIAKPDQLPSRLTFLPLRSTPLVLVGPTTPSALTRTIDANLAADTEPDWSAIPMVLAERGLARERLLARLRVYGVEPNIYAQVAGHEAVASIVSLGFGVAVVPELVIEHSPKRETLRVLPWLLPLPPFELGLAALTDRLSDPLLQAFWKCAERSYPH